MDTLSCTRTHVHTDTHTHKSYIHHLWFQPYWKEHPSFFSFPLLSSSFSLSSPTLCHTCSPLAAVWTPGVKRLHTPPLFSGSGPLSPLRPTTQACKRMGLLKKMTWGGKHRGKERMGERKKTRMERDTEKKNNSKGSAAVGVCATLGWCVVALCLCVSICPVHIPQLSGAQSMTRSLRLYGF